MKLFKILSLILFALLGSFAGQAQTLTPEQKARLNSLPPAMRAQALEELSKLKAQGSGTETKPVEKPDVVKPTQPPAIATKNYENDFKDGTDLAESEETSAHKVITQNLKQFGYDLFAGSPTTFAPATEIPIPVDYVIGPGDQVRIQFFGKTSSSYDLYVSREGVLQVPDLGPITVAGQTFNELKQEITQRVADQMIGMQVFVTLGELRSMRIFMLGDVKRPGAYTVSSLSTMTNALFVSGGIRPIGSLRNIQLKRGGEIVTTLDLYDLLLRGDTSGDAKLQPGDVIFVPPIGKLAGAAGEIRRPAIYELEDGESVGEILEMAGGLTSRAYPSISQIERISEDGLKKLIDVDLSASTNTEMKVEDGDTIRIYSSLDRVENYVRLDGSVERPGDYEWKSGQTISDIITHIEQLLPDADLDYALVVSRHPITGKISTRSFSLQELFLGHNKEHDIELLPKDRVIIFDRKKVERDTLASIIDQLKAQSSSNEPQKVVKISGRVKHPSEYPLDEGMTITSLIRAAGGFTEDAYTLEVELLRYQDNDKNLRDTTLIPVSLSGNEFEKSMSNDVRLQEYDHISVRRIPEWTEHKYIDISGEVRFPGRYLLERGETLSRVIQRAGGLTELAHPESAVFLRESLRISEEQNLAKLREQLRSDIAAASLQRDEFSIDNVDTARALLDQLETTEATGRLVINLPKILDFEEDISVKDGDQLIIGQEPQSITVIGSVNYPTSHLYNPKLNHKEYIDLSGGLTRKADKKNIYIVKANGQVRNDKKSRFFPEGGTAIEAGDTIIVPIDVDRIAPLKLWASTSQIFYQIALGAAAINSF